MCRTPGKKFDTWCVERLEWARAKKMFVCCAQGPMGLAMGFMHVGVMKHGQRMAHNVGRWALGFSGTLTYTLEPRRRRGCFFVARNDPRHFEQRRRRRLLVLFTFWHGGRSPWPVASDRGGCMRWERACFPYARKHTTLLVVGRSLGAHILGVVF
jgi:hypothetical protein